MVDEWTIRTHKIWFDEKDQVLKLKMNGQFTAVDYDEQGKIFEEFYKDKDIPRLSLVDLTDAEEVSSSERRKLKESSQKVADMIDRTALIGASPAVRMVAKVFIKLSGKSESVRFFKTEEEALAWLKE